MKIAYILAPLIMIAALTSCSKAGIPLSTTPQLLIKTSSGGIPAHFHPVPNGYIEDLVPITLTTKAYPDIVMLWSIGDGTKSAPLQVLTYKNAQGSYDDDTRSVVAGKIPNILNPRNFAVDRFDSSPYPGIIIANQGLDASPWPGTTDTLLLSKSTGQLYDASAMLLHARAYTHDASDGVIDSQADIGIFFNNIYSEPNTPPKFFFDLKGSGRFKDSSQLLPPASQRALIPRILHRPWSA
jgi:hypothetical protein